MKHQLQVSGKQVLTQMVHKSLSLLQLPQIELAALIVEEVEKNPLLELESNVVFEPVTVEVSRGNSFYDELWGQIKEALPGKEKIGEKILAEIDERGFLLMSSQELSQQLQIPHSELERILSILKTLDPPGLFASNLQEAFLLQLARKGQQTTLSYRIIQEAFADFLAGKYTVLKKRFKMTSVELQEVVQQIAHLTMRPYDPGRWEPAMPLYPDLRLEGNSFVMVEDFVPKFRWNARYLPLLSSPSFAQSMRSFRITAKWLFRSMQRRKDLLLSMTGYLLRKQRPFFEEGKRITPISMKELAQECGVHESTAFRAVANKTLECQHGLIPLRSLVASSSQAEAKEMLARLIEEEAEPLTDEQLAKELEKAGTKVSRRTIAKYRQQLKIGPAARRL